MEAAADEPRLVGSVTVGDATVMPTGGRPRSFEAGKVLDDVLELFWRNGYRATTMRELESAFGLSQSSLYNAFGSKDDLLSAALDRYEARIDEQLVRPLEAAEGGLDAIDQFFAALGRWVTGNGRRGCMIINLMAEDGGTDPKITQRTRRYRHRVRSALRDALRRAADQGEVVPGDIDARADLLFGLVLGLNIAARGGAARREIHAITASARHQAAQWGRD